MKTFCLYIALLIPLFGFSQDQLVEHQCNDDCSADACFYWHGEKGHKCGKACNATNEEYGHKKDGNPKELTDRLADHVCNDNCKAEACHFQHGEKGHVCGKECKAKKHEEDGHDHDGHDHDH